MKLRCHLIEALEQPLADSLDVRGFVAALHGPNMGRRGHELRAQVGKLLIESGEFLVRGGRKPIHRAEDNAETVAGDRNRDRRMSPLFDGVFDGSHENRVLHDGDHHAPRGEIGHDFLRGRARLLRFCPKPKWH